MQEDNDINEVFIEILGILTKRQVPINLFYFILGSSFCRFSQSINRPLEQILSDIETTFKSLPEPIEEKDEPNQ